MEWTALRHRLIPDGSLSVLPLKTKLPMLPTVVLDFSRKSEDPNCGPQELGRIIETDSGLTCELLRYANSSMFAARMKVSTVQQAISRLGIHPTKCFLLSTAVHLAMKSSQSKLINIQNFWLSNLERALLARDLAIQLKVDRDLAYTASLLQDFLLPAISNEQFDVYVQFVEQTEHERPALVDYEQQRLGWDHTVATAHVLRSWNFPDDLICCARLHHGGLAVVADPQLGRSAAAAVALAALAPDPLGQSCQGLVQLQKYETDHPPFDLMETAHRVAVQLTELTPLGQQHFTLERRLRKAADRCFLAT